MNASDRDAAGPGADPETGRFVRQLTRESFALVLAGGRGSRLMHLTSERAKPAVPFGGKFRIIDFTLSNCVNAGVRRIGIATQYKAHSLIRHIQRGWSFLDGRFDEFVQLLPAQQQVEESWYRGTADAAFQNIGVLRRHSPRYVLVLAGDHIYKMDYSGMLAAHVTTGADMSVGCVEAPLRDASSLGVITADESGRVRAFVEKPAQAQPLPGKPDRVLASMGIYVFNAEFLYEQATRDADERGSTHDFGRDLIPHIVPRYRVHAYPFADGCVGTQPGGAAYWRDVGTVDAYWEANIELTKVVPELNLYDRDWPIWTHQEQLPPAKFVLDEGDRHGMALDSLVSGGCVVSGAIVRRSLLFSDVRVDNYGLVEDSVVLPQVRIGRNAVLKRVILDRGCSIPDGAVIGADPVADARRYHVTERGITLVTPAMLGQATYGIR
jgi:glucose-1-phosphate adenylyltransferase